MKKVHDGQVLLLRHGIVVTQVSFYQVIRSTTRTCEVRKLKKKIIDQSHNEQKVIPVVDDFSDLPVRCAVLDSGCVKIAEKKYARPWKGDPEWQTVVIFIS